MIFWIIIRILFIARRPFSKIGGVLVSKNLACVFYLWRGRLSRRRTMRALLLERAGSCLSPPFKGPAFQGPGLSHPALSPAPAGRTPTGGHALVRLHVLECRVYPPRRAIQCSFASLGCSGVWHPLWGVFGLLPARRPGFGAAVVGLCRGSARCDSVTNGVSSRCYLPALSPRTHWMRRLHQLWPSR